VMLLVQEYLKTHSLEALDREHGIKARPCGHKFSLNYDMIEAKDDDLMAQECRGLILCLADDNAVLSLDEPLGETRVLARPFDRFFNHGQGAAADVDLEHPDTRFYEKMDGTLCILYFDFVKDEWHVATRSVAEADLPIDGFEDFTFRTLFEKACLETTGLEDFWRFTFLLDTKKTYLFELTTPRNRIVVNYENYGITLLGARTNECGTEHDPLQEARAPYKDDSPRHHGAGRR